MRNHLFQDHFKTLPSCLHVDEYLIPQSQSGINREGAHIDLLLSHHYTESSLQDKCGHHLRFLFAAEEIGCSRTVIRGWCLAGLPLATQFVLLSKHAVSVAAVGLDTQSILSHLT